MTKTERIKAALAMQPTDVIPYSLWSHLPGIDMDPEALANATYDFYKRLDIDFIKTMNNGMYPIEDLGCVIDYSEITSGGVARLVATPIKSISDWDNVGLCDVSKGAFARELRSLELLIKRLKDEDVPVIFTVFSPLTTADKLSGKHLLEHIQNGGGSKIHEALERITQSTCDLAKRAIELGAAGIFYATQMSDYHVLDEEIYREYGVPYDLRVIASANGWFNVVHAHGDDIMFDIIKDYPVDAVNWHVWESLPGIAEGQALSGKCVVGGLCRADITNKNKNALRDQIFRNVKALNGRGLILTPGCVIRYPLDEPTFAFIRQAKSEVERAVFKTVTM